MGQEAFGAWAPAAARRQETAAAAAKTSCKDASRPPGQEPEGRGPAARGPSLLSPRTSPPWETQPQASLCRAVETACETPPPSKTDGWSDGNPPHCENKAL